MQVEVRGSTDTLSLLHVSNSAQRCHAAVTVAMLRSGCRKRISGCFEDEGTRDETGLMLWSLYPPSLPSQGPGGDRGATARGSVVVGGAPRLPVLP